MINDIYYNPTKILFGRDTELQVGTEAARYGKRILLHYGSASAKKSGLIDRVKKSLAEAGLEVTELSGVVGNPRLSKVLEGVALCKRHDIELILAVGGGSVIDSSKAIAIGARNDGDLWQDYFVDEKPFSDPLPVATVLTLPGAGSESSDGCVISNEQTGQKLARDDNSLRPVFSILNPELTYTLPAYFTAAGVCDAIAHVMERYFTNTTGVETGDRMCEAVIRSLMTGGKRAVREPMNYEARAEVMWACKVAHDNCLGVGREQDWGSHMIEHELSAKYDISHGAGLAVIFPAWMKYCMKHDVARFAQFACRIFDLEYCFRDPTVTANYGIKFLMRFFESINMPTSLEELGITDKACLAEMAQKCAENSGGTVGNFVKLTKDDILKILELAM